MHVNGSRPFAREALAPQVKQAPSQQASVRFGSSPPSADESPFSDEKFMHFLQQLIPEEKSQRPWWQVMLGRSPTVVSSSSVEDWVLRQRGYSSTNPPEGEALNAYYEDMGVLERLQKQKLIEKINLGSSFSLGGTTSSAPCKYGYVLTQKGYAALKTDS